MYFRNYELWRAWRDISLRTPVLEDPSRGNMVHEPKHCRNLNDITVTILVITLKVSELEKKSLLVLWKTLWLFVNTLTTDGKYSPLNRDNLTQPIQMHLPQKQKKISGFSSAFSKLTLNFKHFQKKDDPHSWYFSEIADSQKCGYIYV